MNKRKILEKTLRFMAVTVLKRHKPLIVGITGSVGKSSTKEAVALVLSRLYEVRKTDGNYNNEIGIPLTIIGAKSGESSIIGWFFVCIKWVAVVLLPVRYPDILVLEVGIDRPGDMEYLTGFLPVKIGIATQISGSHMAYFGSIANIAKEKSRLIAALPEDGTAILNADDKRVMKMSEKTKASVLTYGFSEHAIVRADHIISHRGAKLVEGFSFKLNYDGKSIPVRLPKIVARHYIPAALVAAAVGLALKMNLVEIAESLERFESLPGRLRLLPGRDGISMLDDTYNASPASAEAALEAMGSMMAPRKVAILGDMLELGLEADALHAALASAVIASGANVVMTVGKHMRALHEALLATEEYSRKQLLWMPDPVAAVDAVLKLVRPDDLVLIKGSRSMRMELLVEQLLVDVRDAKDLLCCQTDAWKKRPFVSPAEWMDEETT